MARTIRSVARLTALVVVFLAPPAASGQAHLPRTAWGDPDLQGVWNNNTAVPMERPTGLAGREALTDEEAAVRFHNQAARLFPQDRAGAVDAGLGPAQNFYNEFWFEWGQRDTNRTSLLVDPPEGRLPPTTLVEQERQRTRTDSYNTDRFDSVADFNVWDRCITRGLPGAMIPGFYNHNYHILQTPDYVVLVAEMIHDARIIPLDGRPHVSPHIQQWMGDARGYWEGDTLVVETTNFTGKILRRGGAVFGGDEHARVVERFTRVDAETIDHQITVIDPTVWTRPWTAAIPLNKSDGTLFEYACHEGNYGLRNILVGARAVERADQSESR